MLIISLLGLGLLFGIAKIYDSYENKKGNESYRRLQAEYKRKGWIK